MKEGLRKMLAVAIGLLGLSGASVWAQTGITGGVAEYVPIVHSDEIKEGQIVTFNNGIYELSSREYDENIVGVVSRNSAVAISVIGSAGAAPLVYSGASQVLVAGPIQVGDYITSSSVPGIGIRASKSGYVIGRAVANGSANANEPRLVPAIIEIGFVWPPGAAITVGSLLSNPSQTVANLPRPVRYTAAVAVMLLALLAGYIMYSRTSTSTLAAIGRNPMAKRTIYLLAGYHAAITMLLVTAGVVLGYLILVI